MMNRRFSTVYFLLIVIRLCCPNLAFCEVLTNKTVIKEDMIYEVVDVVDLVGKQMKLAKNCYLIFRGGIIKNGELVGNKSKIEALPVKIFNEDLKVSGNWTVEKAYPEWFGAKADGIHDDRAAIQNCIDNFRDTYLMGDVYAIRSYTEYHGAKRGIVIPAYKSLVGTNMRDDHSQIKTFVELESVLYLSERCNTVEGVFVNGGGVFQKFGTDALARYGVETLGSGKNVEGSSATAYLIFKDMYVAYCKSDGFHILGYSIKYINCIVSQCRGNAFYASYDNGRGPGHNFQYCSAVNCRQSGFKIENTAYSSLLNCSVDNCGFDIQKPENGELYHAYSFSNVNTTNLQSCGEEGCYYVYKLTGGCIGMSFEDCRLYNCTKNLPSKFRYNNVIVVDNAMGIRFSGLWISNMTGGYKVEKGENIVTLTSRARDIEFSYCYIDTKSSRNLLTNNYINFTARNKPVIFPVINK